MLVTGHALGKAQDGKVGIECGAGEFSARRDEVGSPVVIRDERRRAPVLRETRPAGNVSIDNNVAVNSAVDVTFVQQATGEEVVGGGEAPPAPEEPVAPPPTPESAPEPEPEASSEFEAPSPRGQDECPEGTVVQQDGTCAPAE